MAKKKVTREKVSTQTKALAAAKVLVDGKSLRVAAAEAGTSRETARRAAKEAETDPDLRQLVTAYRAKAVPKWLSIVDKASKQAEDALEGAEARDAAFVAKTFAELAQRGAGEPDVKHEHAGSIDGARDALAARIAAIADSKPKG